MLVFIHINKTGGNTVSHILRSSYGLRHCPVEPWHDQWKLPPFSAEDLQRLRRIYRNLKSIGGHRITGYVDLESDGAEFRYFTLMRDPLARCASRFQANVQNKKKYSNVVFEDWIQTNLLRNLATKWIAGVEDVSEAIRIIKAKNIFVGLTERFDESMVLLKALIANDLNISYNQVNVARDNTLAKSLLTNESTRQMLVEAQKLDLELYDFVKQELYPMYQREYGPLLGADVARYQRTRDDEFNRWNLTLSRLKQYMLYKPLLYLHRKGVALV